MFSIIRINKLKNNQQIQAAVSHNLRISEVPNADPEKLSLNQNHISKNYGQVIGKLEQLFFDKKIKPKSDAVLVVEAVLTASPEFFDDDPKKLQQWLNSNYEFIKKEFTQQNVLQVTVHLDEQTPHIHVLFAPITQNNRLSCKELYGGKTKLSALQTRYADAMKPLGLKRGKENSRAKHTTIKQFYALANKIKQLNKEQLRELAELISMFEHTNETNIKNTLSAEIEENLKLLDTINKVKPMLKMNKKL